jgi:uncharacterized membrane protein YfcA
MLSPDLIEFCRLAPIGFAVGAYGTLVGAGGGSVLVPVLLFLLPKQDPAAITAISLAVVFFNAYSGTIAYMRMGRVNYRAGTLFTLAGIPGAILGTLLVHRIPRGAFDLLFGLALVGIGGTLFANPLGSRRSGETTAPSRPPYRTDLIGATGSAYIAVVSSLLGIGGGIIHVPFLIRVLRMPAHTATATSHFVLTFMALTATITHIALGEFQGSLDDTMYLAVGVMMGAPLGAAVSTKLEGGVIIRMLALALCLVGARLLMRMF